MVSTMALFIVLTMALPVSVQDRSVDIVELERIMKILNGNMIKDSKVLDRIKERFDSTSTR